MPRSSAAVGGVPHTGCLRAHPSLCPHALRSSPAALLEADATYNQQAHQDGRGSRQAAAQASSGCTASRRQRASRSLPALERKVGRQGSVRGGEGRCVASRRGLRPGIKRVEVRPGWAHPCTSPLHGVCTSRKSSEAPLQCTSILACRQGGVGGYGARNHPHRCHTFNTSEPPAAQQEYVLQCRCGPSPGPARPPATLSPHPTPPHPPTHLLLSGAARPPPGKCRRDRALCRSLARARRHEGEGQYTSEAVGQVWRGRRRQGCRCKHGST